MSNNDTITIILILVILSCCICMVVLFIGLVLVVIKGGKQLIKAKQIFNVLFEKEKIIADELIDCINFCDGMLDKLHTLFITLNPLVVSYNATLIAWKNWNITDLL
tara:strand:+ start:408 stop:725 length:318 start_codon:yes stop_codon:yes gene_type:complete